MIDSARNVGFGAAVNEGWRRSESPMLATLNETVIFGVHTNIEFLKQVIVHPLFQKNQVSTRFLENEFGYRIEDQELVPENFATLRQLGALLAKKTPTGPPAHVTPAPQEGIPTFSVKRQEYRSRLPGF